MNRDKNKYELQIKTNWYKELGQYQGNGNYGQYVEGCFEGGLPFLCFPLLGNFYLEVDEKQVDKMRIRGEDAQAVSVVPEVFFYYVNSLIDKYKNK